MKLLDRDDQEMDEVLYTLFYVGDNIYGVSSDFVMSIENLKEATTIVGAPLYVRGGVFFNGEFIKLIDMRKYFGMDSQSDELIKSVNIEQRVKDHENWINALETSVTEGVEFNLATDPTQCAFGKWLSSFKSENNALNHQLRKIKGPHSSLHNAAGTILGLMKENKQNQAHAALKELRAGHYKTSIGLLSSLHSAIAESIREIYIIINAGSDTIGLMVDSIVGLEMLNEKYALPRDSSDARYIKFISRRGDNQSTVIVLDAAMIG